VRTLNRTIALALTVAAFAQSALCGQFDWPQWQGPDRTAHSKETGLLQEWPKNGPPLAWKIKGLGGGDSAPSVAGGRIYGMSHRGGDEMVWALSDKDGKEIWAVRIAPAFTTPIYHDGHVFATSAYGAGGGLARLTRNAAGEFAAEEVWFSKSMENHHGGVILQDGALFGANGGNGGGYLACLDFKTGEVLWNERDSDKRRVTKGSVAFADGRIYYRTEEGPIILIEPSRKEYLERGRFDQPERTDKPAWAHPVIANGKLYIRDQETLFCYDIKAK
jgi:outer membrane protein assembly factor BamB